MNSAVFEIGKFARLTLLWLCIIFGAVWGVSWSIGVLLPAVILSQSGESGRFWAQLLQALVPVVAVALFVPLNTCYMVLAERRLLALFTVRKGPNRVGPDGAFQTVADALKLLLKEEITPRGADLLMYTLAPVIFFAPSIIGVMPLLAAVSGNHPLFTPVNLPTGVFYILAVSSIPVVGVVMGGWASNNKYSLVGALRSAAQAISYEIPLLLSIITVCLLAGTLDFVQIADNQRGSLLNWNILGGGALTHLGIGSPWWSIAAALLLAACCILLFALYVICACAEVNRTPFDLPEAESELVSGFNTEYSGIKFAIFFLAEYTNLFIVSTFAAVMFLGGGHAPFPGLEDACISGLRGLLAAWFGACTPFQLGWLVNSLVNPATVSQVFWIIVKSYALVWFASLIRATLPRLRIDQLMDYSWKRLVPLALILLIAVTFLKELV